MSITVSDCLKLPSLRNSRVVAGHNGLNHVVSNVSVLEIYDENLIKMDPVVTDSDITLASFAYIKDDYKTQCQLIEEMYQAGDAAVILYYVGIFLKEIHPSVIEIADRLGFPVIVMPENRMDIYYREVLRDVSEAVFRDSNRKQDFVNNIAALVSRLPENRKNLSTLMQLISDALKCTVLLSDTVMNNISIAKWPRANEITGEEICHLYETSAAETDVCVSAVWKNRPIKIFKIPLTSFEYRNFSVYAADEEESITMNDMYNIAELLELFSKIWNLDADNILINSLIPAILDGDSEKMYQIADRLAIDIHAINTVFFLRPEYDGLETKEKIHLQRDIVKCIKESSQALGKTILVDVYGSLIVGFIIYAVKDEADREYLEDMMEQVHTISNNCTLSFFPCNKQAADVQKTYLLYCETISDVIKIFPSRKYFSYGDLLFAKQCRTICEKKGDALRICGNILSPLLAESDGEVLLETLAVYCLDTDCHINDTAAKLYVHRNTIQYRLHKIQTITNFHADDRVSFALLSQAAACLRLNSQLLLEQLTD